MSELNNASLTDNSSNKENENHNAAKKSAKDLKVDGTLNVPKDKSDEDKNWIVQFNNTEPCSTNDDDEEETLEKFDSKVVNDEDDTMPLNVDFESMSIDEAKNEGDCQPLERLVGGASTVSKRTRRNRKRNAMKNAKKTKKVPIKRFDDPSTTVANRSQNENDGAGPSNYRQPRNQFNRGSANPSKNGKNRKRQRSVEIGFIGIVDIRLLVLNEIMSYFFGEQQCECENCREKYDSDSDSLDE